MNKCHSNHSQSITKDKENGLRLQLLLDKIKELLRKKFHEHHPVDPSQLFQHFNNNKQKLLNLKKKGKITVQQYNLLLPSNYATDSKTFDASLLITLLFEFCDYQLPYPAWKPKPSDKSDIANIVRFRLARNKIQHSPLSISQQKFDEIVDSVRQPMLDFQCPENEIEQIKIRYIDNTLKERIQKLEESLENFNYKFTKPIPNFLGREEEISKIHNLLDSTSDGSTYGVVVCGLPGVGKTELTRKYWMKYAESYYEGRICWINAQTNELIEKSFIEIAIQAGLANADERRKLNPINQIISITYRHFAARIKTRTQRRILFVFDNALDNQQLEPYLPEDNNTEPYIIITSQCRDWDVRFHIFHLDVLASEIATQFLIQNLDETLRKDESKNLELIELLECHPLALQQATSYMKMNCITTEEYVKLFKESDWSRLGDKVAKRMAGKDSVFKTFSLSIEKLHQLKDSEHTLELLDLMAYFDGKSIEKELLKKFCNNDVISLNEALTILQNYSLINVPTIDECTGDNAIRVVTMHSLVQLTVQSLASKKQDEHLDKIIEVLLSNFSEELSIKERGAIAFHQFLYISSQQKHRTKLLLACMDMQKALFSVFQAKGNIEVFITLLKQLEKLAAERHDNNNMIKIKFYMASSINHNGQHQEALQLFRELKTTICITNFGNEFHHLKDYDIDCEIANCQLLAGSYKEALRSYNEALDAFYRVESKVNNSDDYPIVFEIQENIGNCHLCMGRYKEALVCYHKVEQGRLQAFDEEDPSVFTIQHNIAHCLTKMGQYEDALKLYRQVEVSKLQALGNKHPALLTTQHNIAQCLSNMDEEKEALDIYRKVEEAQLQVLGPRHPSTLVTQQNKAKCLKCMGKHKEATDTFFKVLESMLQTLGDKNPNVLTTQHNVARCLKDMGQHEEALELYRIVEEAKVKTLGDKHPSVFVTQRSIATCLKDMNRHGEALDLYLKVAGLQIDVLGKCHPEVIATQKCIQECLQHKDSISKIHLQPGIKLKFIKMM